MFAADFREWNKRVAGDKELPHLKVFFAAAHREWQISVQNETGSPYGASHNSITNPDDGYLHQYTVDVIANLALDMASNCADITQLTAIVVRLLTELVTVNKNNVSDLQEKRASCGRRGRRDKASCRRGDGSASKTVSGAPVLAETEVGVELYLLIHYC